MVDIGVPRDFVRWSARRKAAVLVAIAGGRTTVEEACRRWQLSREELEAWQSAYRLHGVVGLYATRIRVYRDAARRARERREPVHAELPSTSSGCSKSEPISAPVTRAKRPTSSCGSFERVSYFS